MSVEQALQKRRSVKEYSKDQPLTLREVSQLLWAAQGITDSKRGLRTAPSAGATIVFFAAYERTTVRFSDMGVRYVHMEVGHAAQNVYLQAIALNLGTGIIGGFPESQVKNT